nr:translation initiation factor IF-2-like [Anser cygnoides]
MGNRLTIHTHQGFRHSGANQATALITWLIPASSSHRFRSAAGPAAPCPCTGLGVKPKKQSAPSPTRPAHTTPLPCWCIRQGLARAVRNQHCRSDGEKSSIITYTSKSLGCDTAALPPPQGARRGPASAGRDPQHRDGDTRRGSDPRVKPSGTEPGRGGHAATSAAPSSRDSEAARAGARPSGENTAEREIPPHRSPSPLRIQTPLSPQPRRSKRAAGPAHPALWGRRGPPRARPHGGGKAGRGEGGAAAMSGGVARPCCFPGRASPSASRLGFAVGPACCPARRWGSDRLLPAPGCSEAEDGGGVRCEGAWPPFRGAASAEFSKTCP